MLRAYSRNPAMGVVIFRHEPLNCGLLNSPDIDLEDMVDTRTRELCIIFANITCFIVVAIGATATFRFWKLGGFKRILVSNKSKSSFAFRNLENCTNSITMSEGVISDLNRLCNDKVFDPQIWSFSSRQYKHSPLVPRRWNPRVWISYSRTKETLTPLRYSSMNFEIGQLSFNSDFPSQQAYCNHSGSVTHSHLLRIF